MRCRCHSQRAMTTEGTRLMVPLAANANVTKSDEREERARWARLRWRRSVPACVILMVAFGFAYGMAILSPVLAKASPEFSATYTAALGTQSFARALAILVFAFYLDENPTRVRLVVLCAALMNAVCLALMALSIAAGSSTLLFWATALLGLGLGTFYIAGLEQIARWLPEHVGLSMAFVMGGIGVGSTLSTKCFDFLTHAISIESVMLTLGVFFVLPPISVLPAIGFPSAEVMKMLQNSELGRPHAEPERQADASKGSRKPQKSKQIIIGRRLKLELLRQPSFYFQLMIVGLCCGPSFGVVVAFPNITRACFNADDATIASLLSALNLLCMFAGLATSFCVDLIGFGSSFFSSGAKNIAILLLALETVAFTLAREYLARPGELTKFTVCAAVLFIGWSVSGVIAAVMARQLFAPANSALVFGCSGGLTGGVTTMFFASMLVSMTQSAAQKASTDDSAAMVAAVVQANMSYFRIGAICCAIGTLCAIVIQKCRAAFEIETDAATTVVLIEQEIPTEKEHDTVKEALDAVSAALANMTTDELEEAIADHVTASFSSSYQIFGGASLQPQIYEAFEKTSQANYGSTLDGAQTGANPDIEIASKTENGSHDQHIEIKVVTDQDDRDAATFGMDDV